MKTERRAGDVNTHGDVGTGETSPAEKVNEPVEAGQLAAARLLAFGKGWRFGGVQVIDGGHHSQACNGATHHPVRSLHLTTLADITRMFTGFAFTADQVKGSLGEHVNLKKGFPKTPSEDILDRAAI